MTEEKTTATKATKAIEAEEPKTKKSDSLKSGTMVMCDDGVERPVITREEAIADESNRYFTGLPCQNGHLVERKVKGYVCTTCARIRAKARRKKRLEEDPDYKEKMAVKRREKHKARYASDPDYKEKILQKAKDRRTRATVAKKLSKAENEVKESAVPADKQKAA